MFTLKYEKIFDKQNTKISNWMSIIMNVVYVVKISRKYFLFVAERAL